MLYRPPANLRVPIPFVQVMTTIRCALVLAIAVLAPAQTAREIGTVIKIEADRIELRTDAGADVTVRFDESTKFQRVAPGEKDLSKAAAIAPSDVAAGDRVLARGSGNPLVARSVIVMAKTDIARKQAADRAEWERRGIGGIVTAVNAPAQEITVSSHGRSIVVKLADKASVRRYAPESVRFADAKPSRIEEIQTGDQVRALGNKSEDGTRYVAEELVSGSFLNIAATVNAVDAANNTLRVTDLTNRKKITVHVTPDSALRKLPAFAAGMLARFQGRREGASNPLGAPSGNGGPGSGPMRQGPPDLQRMLERTPPITLADLKPGDTIAVASTRGADPSRMTAITILAGIEPLLEAQSGRQGSLGSWNLDLNMNMSLP